MGASYYRGGNPGKLLAIASQIRAGDFESAYKAYHDAGVEARTLAEQAAAKRHNVSAREAVPLGGRLLLCGHALSGRHHGARAHPTVLARIQRLLDGSAAALFDPPVERLEIPYEGGNLTGWFLRASDSRHRRPLVILNNGSDGLESSMYIMGGAGALARGYNCLIFNGPGQGDSLWVRKLYFRPDWEKAITPVVDAMLRHPEVDAKRIALVGVSHGGYCVPRALAYETRIAAGVADPGVCDASEPWLRNLPKFVRDKLDAGDKAQFDQMLQMGTASNTRAKMTLRFRMRPLGMTSYYDAFHGIQEYKLGEAAARIRCPMLITDPEGEQFFPGQAQKLYDALRCPKKIAHFTPEQGADQHCEVAAPGYRDCCIYDWLDETFQ